MPPPAETAAASPVAIPVLQVTGLRFAHPGQPPIFDGLDFALPAGLTRLEADIGKTTLVRLLAGELRGEGRYLLGGRPWQPDAASGEVCRIEPRNPDWDGLTPDGVMAAVRARHAAFDTTAWERHRAAFGLDEHRHKTMHMLSTGSRRKVALAAALAAGARLTLLDEPTGGLDRPSIATLARALAEQAAVPGQAWLLAAAWGLEQAVPWAAVLPV